SIATHYRDEIVPLRKAISEENLLRYNGMIIGVFELLADSRQQIAAVMGAIDSKKQFWMADIGLQAALAGNPRAVTAISANASSIESSKGH
ncbi:MAG: transporter, partial [Betaproteobacteria bacterium]